jgi:hypothetical protein
MAGSRPEGQVVHLATHEPGARRVRGVRRITALPVASRRLGIAGVADLSSLRSMLVENVTLLARQQF